MAEKQITLPDGRCLGVAFFGERDGSPIIYCHGFPASRLEAQVLDAAARELGIALIAPDRPGIGKSDFCSQRRLTDWPRDVKELASALDLDRFATLAVSGGAPYALACAHALPDRVTAVALVAALGPVSDPDLARHMQPFARFGLRFARDRPESFARLLQGLSPLLLRNPRLAFRIKKTNQADQRALDRDGVRSALFRSVQESVRQGGRGIAVDLSVLASPWEFALEEITTPVRIWHGLNDLTVPPVMSEFLADALPNATLSLHKAEGHVSLSADHSREILKELLEHGNARELISMRSSQAERLSGD